jgi:CHASE2 domain-containing sensor protein
MSVNGIKRQRLTRSVQGAVLTALVGLMLGLTPIGTAWTNTSYDYLFRFGSRPITNSVAVIMMDNEAYAYFDQTRGQPWDRALHAQVLNKLADDGCAAVVMDCFFREAHDRAKDEALATAMRRQKHVVLMAEQSQISSPAAFGMHPLSPAEPFLSAAGKSWGVAWLNPDSDLIVRRHWPFPAPGPYPSLAEVAARAAGATIGDSPQDRWLRYYGPHGAWVHLSYRYALSQRANYFRDKIVFIGTEPQTSVLDGEADDFCTPYTRWTNETSGGVEIMMTSFLNLVNHDWLRRTNGWVEALMLTFAGALLGGSLVRTKGGRACLWALVFSVAVALVSISCSFFTNYWFPWLVIAGGQSPFALVWALGCSRDGRFSEFSIDQHTTRKQAEIATKPPDIPGYHLLSRPFGEGAYGTVWLARNPAREWRAIKVIYRAKFNNDDAPYDREFNGISRFRSISDKHPTLLRIDFVSQKFADYFYYAMELGDAVTEEWEKDPGQYVPHDLANDLARRPGRRIPIHQCLTIGMELCDGLDFLHHHGLTHRDIKPQNIIFVKNRPKFTDLGLVAEIRPDDQRGTAVGTPGYMPPAPEVPGTPQADIYALGMVLYVISTGHKTAFFPEIATTLADNLHTSDFFALNVVILKACQPDPTQRYGSAREMGLALQEVQGKMLRQTP